MSDTHGIAAIMHEMGLAGQRMVEINAAEGAAGNLSVFLRDAELVASDDFPNQGNIELPVAAPALGGGWLVVSCSGRRLRDIAGSAPRTLCLLHVGERGLDATLFAGNGERPTSELNSHLAVHDDHVGRRGLTHHAVLHAQPLHLTYLGHITAEGDTVAFNRRLLRWQPETIMQFPEGLGVLPFELPGTMAQARGTAAALQTYHAVIWQRHGIVARADGGVLAAADLVDYAEAAARYAVLHLQLGEPGNGLSDDEMRRLCGHLGITQSLF